MDRTNPDSSGTTKPTLRKILHRLYRSPAWLLVIISSAIVIANVVGMLILLQLPDITETQAFILDVVLVLSALAPFLYFFVFKPLVVQLEENRRFAISLSDTEERFRSCFENSLDGMILATTRGNVLAANPAACAFLGRSVSELKQVGRAGIMDTENPHHQELLALHARTGKFKGELQFLKQDGTPFPVEVSSSIFTNSAGIEKSITTFRDITEKQTAQKELRRSYDRLRMLAAHIQRVREEERTIIAREIHDELGQVLATVQMGVSLLVEEYSDHRHLTEKISGFERMLEGAIKSVQRISSELRPMMLDTLGLGEAIEWQAKEFQKNTGIICNTSILLENDQFHRDVSTAMFRIFQETLTNVIRHSEADQVDVLLEERKDRLVLVVRDNGKGISRDQLKHADSLGIMGIRERAYALGGRAKIFGTPGKGTTIIAHIPVKPKDEWERT